MAENKHEFRMGILLDEQATSQLLELQVLSSASAHSIITNAINTMWKSLVVKDNDFDNR